MSGVCEAGAKRKDNFTHKPNVLKDPPLEEQSPEVLTPALDSGI